MTSFADVRRQVETLGVAERCFDSLILFALADLGVFRKLADGPRTPDDLGEGETLRGLLDAGVAVGLLAREGDAYAAPAHLVACLGTPGGPADLTAWLRFLRELVPSLARLADTARDGRPHGALPMEAMTEAMDGYARTRGVELATKLDFAGDRTLLDVGCGPGTYAFAILERHPDMTATLLDSAVPIAAARRLASERGLADRVRCVEGDALAWDADAAYDVVLVSNMLHMIGPDASQRLLARCRDMVRPGGRLLVQAEYLDASRTSPRWPTLLNLILRATTEHGRNHSVDETAGWLRAAGFADVEHRRLSPWNVNSVLVARRPS